MTWIFATAWLAAGYQAVTLDLPKRHLPPKPKPEAILAKVGGVPIRAADVESYLWDWRAYEAVQDAVTHQLIAGEAKKRKISVDPAVIDAELAKQLARVKEQLRPGQTLNQALLEQGFTRSRLWLRIRSEQLLDRLVMASFDPKPLVKVSTIVIRPRSEQASDLAEALKRAEEAYQSLKNGEPWGDVLGRFTDDTSTLQNQGLLGWRELSAFPPTVQQEMAQLKPGAITKPAQTTTVIQIFRIEALGASAQGPVLNELKEAYRAGSKQRFLDNLRKSTKVEIFLGK